MKICKAINCTRPVLAKGLCNAHYIRKRMKYDFDKPIKVLIKNQTCNENGCNKKVYGLGACQKHYSKNRRISRWDKLIELKGGKCFICKKSYPRCVYDLHHRDPTKKDIAMGAAIGNSKWENVLKEAEKCDLLCANCHRELHFG